MDPTPPPLTVKEAAAVLKLTEPTVREHIRTGLIKALRIGRSYRIPASEMDRLTGVQASA